MSATAPDMPACQRRGFHYDRPFLPHGGARRIAWQIEAGWGRQPCPRRIVNPAMHKSYYGKPALLIA